MINGNLSYRIWRLNRKRGLLSQMWVREEVQTFLLSSFCFSRCGLSSRALSSITTSPLFGEKKPIRANVFSEAASAFLKSKMIAGLPSCWQRAKPRGTLSKKKIAISNSVICVVTTEVECGTPRESDSPHKSAWFSLGQEWQGTYLLDSSIRVEGFQSS